VGSVECEVFDHELSEARDPSDFEARMRTHESTSGFMRFHTIDHGAWLATLGSSGQARMYTIGNPLTTPVHTVPGNSLRSDVTPAIAAPSQELQNQ